MAPNFDFIYDHPIEDTVGFLDRVADFSLLQNQQVVVVVYLPQQLLRMDDTHFYLLSKVVEGFCCETAEKKYFLEGALVGLF